jgi:hypothetical protein
LILIAEGSFDDEYQDQIIHLPITWAISPKEETVSW